MQRNEWGCPLFSHKLREIAWKLAERGVRVMVYQRRAGYFAQWGA